MPNPLLLFELLAAAMECFAGAEGLESLPVPRRNVELPDRPAPAVEFLSAFCSLEALACLAAGRSSIEVAPAVLLRVVLGACALGAMPALR